MSQEQPPSESSRQEPSVPPEQTPESLEALTETAPETSDLETPDLETSDLGTSDLEIPDLETSDLEIPNLETSDLGTSDLEIPDLETSDLEIPDLETPDQISPEAVAETPSESLSEIVPEDGVEPFPAAIAEQTSATVSPPVSPPASPVVSGSQPLAATLQTTWKQVQPVLKRQTAKTLRVTIQVLEGLLEKLEEKAPAPGTASEGNLPPTLETTPSEPVPSLLTEDWQEKFRAVWEKIRPYWQRFQAWWAVTLPKIREILPPSVNQKLSDRALSGAIAGILVVLLWFTSGVLFGQPTTANKAVPPPKVKIPERPKPTIQKPAAPQKTTAEKPTAQEPIPQKPSTQKTSTQKPSAPKTSAQKPDGPQPSPVPSVQPSVPPAPPPLRLTPEQKLIARIQDQVAEISNQYVNGLIQSVQANFRISRLTVKLEDGWYGLDETQQDKLANELLRRAQQLNFSKLELTDSTETLLARSPVVGSEMVMLKRSHK